MALDDDDDDRPSLPTPAAATTSDEGPSAEDALEDEVQDFAQFSYLFNKKSFSAQTIRKGEKDFEEHGTLAQSNALEQSRQAMEDVLSYTRVHRLNNWCRGWYIADAWADHEEEATATRDRDEDVHNHEEQAGAGSAAAVEKPEPKRGAHSQHRVVAVDVELGRMFGSMGRHIPNVQKTQPGWNKLWLLPEEALFLVERGSLDLWWPSRPLADIFPIANREPVDKQDGHGKSAEKPTPPSPRPADPDDYDFGLPLSLQAAYSLLIGVEGDRGKVTLEKYQVYANLRRNGYIVLRAPLISQPSLPQPFSQLVRLQPTLWQWLFSLLSRREAQPDPPPLGPLVRPGFYRSYKPIFEQLAVIPRHRLDSPTPQSHDEATHPPSKHPFRIHFHVWKASGDTFSKTRPRSPDFHMATIDARTTSVPTLDEASLLLQSSPWDPPKEAWRSGSGSGSGPGAAQPGGGHHLYTRLKHGYRNVILAVVDNGLVNYLRFAEAAFGEEPIWQRFDSNVAPRGGKLGGGGARRGRGGGRGGGPGRGRGRGRGGGRGGGGNGGAGRGRGG